MASAAAEAGDSGVRAVWNDDIHPWRRYGARSIDIFIFGNLITIAVMIIAMVVGSYVWPALAQWLMAPPKWANFIIFTPMAVIVTGVANALCHARWGSTPGKWIFRLRVRQADGQRLSVRTALARELNLCWWGLGLGVVLLSLLMLARSHADLENDGRTKWDSATGAQSTGQVITGGAHTWIILGAIAVILAKATGLIAMFLG